MFLVLREGGDDDLHIVAHVVGKEGADGTVGQSHSERGRLGWPPLAAEERTWDTAGRVEPLLKVHGEGEEIDPLTGRM